CVSVMFLFLFCLYISIAVQDTVLDGSTNSVSLVNEANKEFSFRLYRKLAAHADSQGENIFFSPASVSAALAALSVGAQGETHRQLFSGLGFNSSLLTQTDEDASEGTAVFVDDEFKPKPEFLQTLKQSYFTDGFNVDFNKTTESADTINKYVEEKTNGKIDKLVGNLDPKTVMCLISYIYYKVDMMNMKDHFHIYHDHDLNTTVLQLPFNSSYSMLLMLPGVMATLENAISPNHVTKWLKAMVIPRLG
uniref:Thyroxine-binding globulin n=1 Tax=Sander lucioperca TaxID=283035 RepID=A0A8D0A7Q2_SANLU